MKKALTPTEAALVIVVLIIVFFVATYGTYMQIQQSYCAKDINTPDCVRTYQVFMQKSFSLKAW